MSRHIGILGCSSEGAALCYRTICLEAEPLMGRHAHPQITLHNFCLADYMKHIEPQADWKRIAELMLRSAEALKKTGADFVITPDNTIHEALPHVLPRSPLPWLHIAEEVGKEAQRQRYKRLGLTGTRYLVNGPVYPEKLKQMDIEYVLPSRDQQKNINNIIFDELVRGEQKLESLFYFRPINKRLEASAFAAVVL